MIECQYHPFSLTGRKEFQVLNLKDTVIGLEFGSTRIKAVLVDRSHNPLASGSHDWENRLVNGIWTYTIEDIITGMQHCFAELKADVLQKYGVILNTAGAMGISAMMHGYLPTDEEGAPLTEFRTWRNTITGKAAAELSELFSFNIPERWTIAHLYQAILNGEGHIGRISHLNTLAVYIHEKLTGEFVAGIGEASGIMPVDDKTLDYSQPVIESFDRLISSYGYPWKFRDILPKCLPAGSFGGRLTEKGALLLDPAGDFRPGVPFAPPEGDAGTGMAATNSIAPRTGNVSAGTSDFAMVVLDKPIKMHREIDIVATPDGKPVAMVHCNNCTSDLNAWIGLFGEFAEKAGLKMDKNALYTMMFKEALDGEPDCGGLVGFNYLSGESITGFTEGRPLLMRMPNARLTLPNFMREMLLSSLATLKIGLDILTVEEKVPIDCLYGHGGLFKTPVVGQKLLSAAVGAPVSVMTTAGEGGPYGMALLCAYMLWRDSDETLADYLNKRVFADALSTTVMADESDIRGFERFLCLYQKALPVHQAAVAVTDKEV